MGEGMGTDMDDVGHVLHDAVAQGGITLEDDGFRGGGEEMAGHVFVDVDDGANLEEIEGGFAAFCLQGKFDFDGTSHFLRANLEDMADGWGDGEDIALEHAVEGDEFAAGGGGDGGERDTGGDAVVLEVEGGEDVAQGFVGGGKLADGAAGEIERVVGLELAGEMGQIEGEEVALGVA